MATAGNYPYKEGWFATPATPRHVWSDLLHQRVLS